MIVRSAALLLLLWLSARADTLILRNGTRITGRWWAIDNDVITFLVNDRLERYPRQEASEVIFGPATGSIPPAAAEAFRHAPQDVKLAPSHPAASPQP